MKITSWICVTLVIWYAIQTNVQAQSQRQTEVNLNDLQAPNSPAFILLDVAPTSIERPTTSKAFATSIINSVVENNGIPQNYAVEFTPFWFFKHPGFTSYKYYGINSDGSKKRPFSSLRMTAVSMAFVNKMSPDTLLPRTSNISIGLRTTLLKMISKKDQEDIVACNSALLKKLNPSMDILANIAMDMEDNNTEIVSRKEQLKSEQNSSAKLQLINIITSLESKSIILNQKYKQTLDSLSGDPEITKAENNLKEVLARRPLFSIDGAAALNWAFDYNKFSKSSLSRAGAWLTMNLSLPLSGKNANQHKYYLSVYLTGRYLSGRLLDTDGTSLMQDYMDSGGKLELELSRFTLSYEYLYRYNFTLTSDHSFRSSGLVKFNISDALYLSAAFGKNFGDSNNLIAQLGINWSFGSGNEKVHSTPTP